ncbi:hypothetical protein PGT21_010512 [Puccinia graminis f. sp. tritici]|uniref:Uncharacterized protein n=1 Tax=Puccinia graminis f. sp. tritici TaxID=56615 RepID=A0A5B0ML90_PUCGR|nr:hypothetical protein PGT21_010512 [Puccinia graminis f. sp. tritici]
MPFYPWLIIIINRTIDNTLEHSEDDHSIGHTRWLMVSSIQDSVGGRPDGLVERVPTPTNSRSITPRLGSRFACPSRSKTVELSLPRKWNVSVQLDDRLLAMIMGLMSSSVSHSSTDTPVYSYSGRAAAWAYKLINTDQM